MLRTIDDVLNRCTMYRVVTYGLAGLLLVAVALGLTGMIGIAAPGLVLSTAILCASSYVANKLFSWLLHAPYNSESWLISALILACILPTPHSPATALYAALAGLLAMASKYFITYRGTHIFNPAAFAAFVLSITGLLPATWWIATPYLTPFTILLGLLVLRKTRRFQLFLAFAIPATLLLLFTGTVLEGVHLTAMLHGAAFSWPIIFFGSIMLTEPATLPPTTYYRTLLAIIVGVLFSAQLHAGRLATTPEAVLLVGNLLVVLAVPSFGVMLRLKHIRQLSPDAFELSFARPQQLRYNAGQYMELTLPHRHVDSRGNRRTFSITSGTSEPELKFAFRRFARGSSFKQALLALEPGALVRAAHVAGNFTLPEDVTQRLLFIAGGIGITPFHSMIASLRESRDIIVLYAARSRQDFVYVQDFEAARTHGIRTHYLTDDLPSEELRRLVPDLAQRMVYLSGPDGMVRARRAQLKTLGVHASHIKTDYFTGY